MQLLIFYSSLYVLFITSTTVLLQRIIVEPKSLLVALEVGAQAVFTCVVQNGHEPYWRVNTVNALLKFQKQHLESRGYFIEENVILNENTTLQLCVNISYSNINNSEIACMDVGATSRTALLVTVNELPLPRNPMLTQLNRTTLLVQWSPPYLWPGYSIDSYNVSVRDMNTSITTFHQVDTAFSDVIVDFVLSKDSSLDNNNNCTEYTIGIAAITGTTRLHSIKVTGGYARLIHPGSITTFASVLYDSDRTPLFTRIVAELPHFICSFQELNLTITIQSKNGTLLSLLGPIHHHGPGKIQRDITFNGLSEGQMYLAQVVVDSTLAETLINNLSFSTIKHAVNSTNNIVTIIVDKEAPVDLAYRVTTGLFSALFIISLLLSIICVCTICYRKFNKEQHTHNQANRHQNTLVRNPIYDGPVYDTIVPNLHSMADTSTESRKDKESKALEFVTLDNCSTNSYAAVTMSGAEEAYTVMNSVGTLKIDMVKSV